MVFQLTWFRYRVTFGCFFLWMITRNWWGFDNFNCWAHCSHIRVSIIQSKLLVVIVSFCENITRCAIHNSPSVVSLSLSLSLSLGYGIFSFVVEIFFSSLLLLFCLELVFFWVFLLVSILVLTIFFVWLHNLVDPSPLPTFMLKQCKKSKAEIMWSFDIVYGRWSASIFGLKFLLIVGYCIWQMKCIYFWWKINAGANVFRE